MPDTSEELKRLYQTRFKDKAPYRGQVWSELCRFFEKWIEHDMTVMDVGCGHCEFINAVSCGTRYGMDLNSDSVRFAAPGVNILHHDCSEEWPVAPGSIDVIFTSNFFEHLPTKKALERTLQHAYTALAPGGRLIAMGPNIKCVPGRYWDFFDHYLPLTELSLSEILIHCGFTVRMCRDRFLPYTMSDGREYPLWTLRAYLRVPLVWRIFGEQFLIVASR